jgi:hypothetical protein
MHRSKTATSIDHFVGAHRERFRHGQAERLGGGQIDHEIELSRLLGRPQARATRQS